MTTATSKPDSAFAQTPGELDRVTGVHLMQGVGHRPARGFWADAWSQVLHRRGAVAGIIWISIVAFFAIFAPFVANGRPILMRTGEGADSALISPMLRGLTAIDIMLVVGAVAGLAWMLWPRGPARSFRIATLIVASLQAGLIALAATIVEQRVSGSGVSDRVRAMEQSDAFVPIASAIIAICCSAPFLLISPIRSMLRRAAAVAGVGLVCAIIIASAWKPPLERFDYIARVARGEAAATYTVIPFSPRQGSTALGLKAPGATPYTAVIYSLIEQLARDRAVGGFSDDPRWEANRQAAALALAGIEADAQLLDLVETITRGKSRELPAASDQLMADLRAASAAGEVQTAADVVRWFQDRPAPRFLLGTDSLGQDMLSQLLHACRLSISIGLVSTGIAVVIGVTMGALMGYFGGWVDMLLYRVVEVFMAVPVLFLLIVAAAVLPRNTYVMMAIIGGFTWTGAARFVRAEFYKLRGQDFVQSARAVGLPLRSVLFRHMLPNGVTPVLVEASFAIAAAILIEAVISFLGFGPANQPSWGRLLADATNQVGEFVWWLAVFPGFAIFLTVLSYNLIGEALRDAIDPKLKKARV
ncbi:MAG: ABC transporter permease [Phycisphaerales bacterium JB039]